MESQTVTLFLVTPFIVGRVAEFSRLSRVVTPYYVVTGPPYLCPAEFAENAEKSKNLCDLCIPGGEEGTPT